MEFGDALMATKEDPVQNALEAIKPKKSNKKKGKMDDWEAHVQATYKCKCFKCPGLYANELMTFVGFRGHQQQPTPQSHSQGILNILDVKGGEFEGEAHPRPKVPVSYINKENLQRITGKTTEQMGRLYFLGILEYEVELLTLKFTLEHMGHPHVMILMGRGLGKTWMEDWENSMGMRYFGKNILLLSESDAGKDVGDWIHTWATENNYLQATNQRKGGKRGSYLDFKLYNDAKLYVYGYMEKHSLGKHEIKIVGDDIVNLDWQNRPSDEKRARKHWGSNLNHMNRTGLDLWGTRKYEGDLLGHFIKIIKDLILIKLSPFKACKHHPLPDENGVFDFCHDCKNDNLVAPEIHSYEEYVDKKEEDYDAWYSEQMQNPHRKEGGMIDPSDIHYTRLPHFSDNVILGGTGVDCADTTEQRNDMVGIISALSQRVQLDKSERGRRRFILYASDVARRLARNSEVKEKKKPCDWVDKDGKKIVRGIIESVQVQCEYHMKHYPHVPYIVAWERNRSGIVIMEQALLEFRKKAKVEIENGIFVRLTWPAYLVPDHKTAIKYKQQGKTNVPLGINHGADKGSKEKRVYGALKFSIEEGQTRLTVGQKNTVFYEQLIHFPKGHDDGPDAAAMIKHELNLRWSGKPLPRSPYNDNEVRDNKLRLKWEADNYPWVAKQKAGVRRHQAHIRKLKRYGLWGDDDK